MWKELFWYWAKASRYGPGYHLVINHAIDIGCVAGALWDHYLSDRDKAIVRRVFGVDDDCSAKSMLCWFVSLHDIGKVSPGFQKKRPDLSFSTRFHDLCDTNSDKDNVRNHPLGTLAYLWIKLNHGVSSRRNKRKAGALARILGGHHGRFQNCSDDKVQITLDDDFGGKKWQEARDHHFDTLLELFHPPKSLDINKDISKADAVFMSGFVSLCDWISSDSSYFDYFSATNLEIVMEEEASRQAIWSYCDKAWRKADKVVQELGFGMPKNIRRKLSFKEIFGFIPYPWQELAGKLAASASGQFMQIFEVPTGRGKTEAGLWVSTQTNLVPVYYGLPTQATSNAQFERLLNFVRKVFGEDSPVALSVSHSQTSVLHDKHGDRQRKYTINGIESISHEFFFGRRKTLFAPFGIGTVDQIMLGAIRSKHFFTRLFALREKTIIIDEAHTYDAYMIEPISTLIEYLRELGCNIVIMTATLTTERKKNYIAAFQGKSVDEVELSEDDDKYPSIFHCDLGSNLPIKDMIHPIESPSKTMEFVQVRTCSTKDDEPLLDVMHYDFKKGGCLGLIRNIVEDVRSSYKKLSRDYPGKVKIYHSRLPYFQRLEVEKYLQESLGKYGYKQNSRPERLIVVASPVIQECLDISMDRIYGDVCPFDGLLQRGGRGQRFEEYASRIPEHLRKFIYYYMLPIGPEGTRDYGASGKHIYYRSILDKTVDLISQSPTIRIPEDVKRTINDAYRPLFEQEEEVLKKLRGAQACIPSAIGFSQDASALLEYDFSYAPDDENAMTRLIDLRQARILCIKKQPDGSHRAGPKWETPIDLDRKDQGYWMDKEVLRSLMMVEVKVPLYDKQNLRLTPMPQWKDIPQYRDYLSGVKSEENDDDGNERADAGGVAIFINRNNRWICNKTVCDETGLCKI